MTDEIDIHELTPDAQNANEGTPRGLKLLDESLRELGAGRSILLDKHFRIIAGNKTVERAADLGLDKVIVVESDGTRLVAVRRTDLDLDEPGGKARKLAYADNRIAELDLDWDAERVLADAQAMDLAEMFTDAELKEFARSAGPGEESDRQIGRGGRLYNAGEGHDIEPFKLAYRIEAAYRAAGGLALDLYSGEGQLASWYERRFERVIRVDKNVADVDYKIPALKFLQQHLPEFMAFDFVDFDDEGSPAREIQTLFAIIQGKKQRPFMLCLTDGNGLNLKLRGKFNPEMYLQDNDGIRAATAEDYEQFEETVTQFIEQVAGRYGFTPTPISSYRGREGNVVYQTWLIVPAPSGALEQNEANH